MAEDDLFNTPFLQFIYMREDFLKQHRNNVVWGKLGSKERILALDGLQKYMRKTMEFAEKHGGSNLEINDVLFDHKNLVFDMNLLPNLPCKEI